MSDIAKTTGAPTTSDAHPRPEPAAHEAYSFACMRCGHGWEQAYEIVHQLDGKGELHVVYYADGERVPSPLSHPDCLKCSSDVVRIMRSGQVSMVSDAIAHLHQRQPGNGRTAKHDRHDKHGKPEESADGTASAAAARGRTGSTAEDGPDTGKHHWHLSDLLHPFQHHRR
ncbi:hypothetical protein [Streptomyces lydicus]|uniref:C2H2-type domain-containing protein n=1 Tax=Streptomyces lydicus TaxID=47763 RepID=A0A1D7VF94_9ACTN|nr:hypothetical protein [Streptomyces lydicus]AOP45434.1 hypothetical protein SL103_03520 [Streptomyces lydicus]